MAIQRFNHLLESVAVIAESVSLVRFDLEHQHPVGVGSVVGFGVESFERFDLRELNSFNALFGSDKKHSFSFLCNTIVHCI